MLATTSIVGTKPALEERPQALVIESQSGRIEVGAFYSGTSTMAADGTTPPGGPPLVEGATIALVYPVPGWTFTAVAKDDEAGVRMPLDVTAIDDERFAGAAPPPGSYEVVGGREERRWGRARRGFRVPLGRDALTGLQLSSLRARR